MYRIYFIVLHINLNNGCLVLFGKLLTHPITGLKKENVSLRKTSNKVFF